MPKSTRCPKCRKLRPMTKHHVIPRRIYENNETVDICRECHDELETRIALAERQVLRTHEEMYRRVLRQFLS